MRQPAPDGAPRRHRGELRLSASAWPEALTVECAGHRPLEWDPGRYWTNHARTLFLVAE